MYILLQKQINTQEDLFFSDAVDHADKLKIKQFNELLHSEHKNSFFRHQISSYKSKDEYGNFVYNVETSIFKTVEQARAYFNALTNSQEEIRLKTRDWNQQHKILTNVEILNITDRKSVKELSNCLTNTCERFGGKCNEETGCSTVPFAKEYAASKKQFPIKVVSI